MFVDGVPRSDERAASRSLQGKNLLHEGSVLYGVHCSTCHAVDLGGTKSGPTLLGTGGAGIDFYLTTGRMPLAVPKTQAFHMAPHFDTAQVAALDAYVDSRATRTIPIPSVVLDETSLAAGRSLFENNCQACHGAGAQGATVGYQWTALPLREATPTQIGEAIRYGPGVMPRFTPQQLSAADIDAVATYVRYLVTQPGTYGGTVMDYLGPTAEGFVGAVLGVGMLFWVVFYTGTKANGRRLNDFEE